MSQEKKEARKRARKSIRRDRLRIKAAEAYLDGKTIGINNDNIDFPDFDELSDYQIFEERYTYNQTIVALDDDKRMRWYGWPESEYIYKSIDGNYYSSKLQPVETPVNATDPNEDPVLIEAEMFAAIEYKFSNHVIYHGYWVEYVG